jgi:hypothetical protein
MANSKKRKKTLMLLDIIRRTFAVIVLKVTGVFVGGSVIGLDLKSAAAMAALAGIIDVAQELSRSFLADGKLDPDEINRAFGKIANAPIKKKEDN